MSTRKSTRFQAAQDENTPTNDGIRRSGRKITPSTKHEYIRQLLTPTKTKGIQREHVDATQIISDDDDDDEMSQFEDGADMKKVSVNLLYDNNEVSGKLLCAFKTPKKDGMLKLAENVQQTPYTPSTDLKMLSLNASPRTPRTHVSAVQRLQATHTPSTTRAKIKQVLKKRTQTVIDETESESSADEHSEYEAENDEDESSDDEDEDEEKDSESTVSDDSDDDSVLNKTAGKRTHKVASASSKKKAFSEATPATSAQLNTNPLATNRMSTRTRSKGKSQVDEFIPDSDNYFITALNKKSKTSDHTLDRLKASRLQHEDLFRLLSTMHMSEEHQYRVTEMVQCHQTNFDRWMLEMSKGYNIILYGSGSKQQLLHKFCETHLADKPLIVVNGFFPSITIKDILQMIKVNLLEISTNSRNDHETVDLIASTLNSIPNGHVFLVLNNIDGVMLRKTKDQHIISRLTKIKNFHLIASIDHINALLMWDQTCMNNFNFVWYDCTTMLPYTNETAFENSVFFQNSGDLDLAAMSNVFQSLTKNARGIYMILVNSQIVNQKDSNYQGMTFKELYQRCRENFLVSSDSTLRTQLIEFVDHNMAKIKRSHDGTELVSIPIGTQILSIFAQQQND